MNTSYLDGNLFYLTVLFIGFYSGNV